MTKSKTGISRRLALLSLAASAPAVSAAAAVADTPIQAVLRRLLGSRAGKFHLSISKGPVPHYSYVADSGRVSVKASSSVAALRGVYDYLSVGGMAHLSWEGNRVALPHRLPGGRSGEVASPFAHRVYMNTCTFGYTTAFWDWTRWQSEIDWMALHGIDMPLAMEGQEWVWRRLWQECGLDDAELASYFSGPAFAPWHRMGNIEGYMAPLALGWIVKKRDLQKRILTAMRGLGMEPILPAFGGYVPKAFAEKHPKARIYRMRPWEGFHETYWLDPADPLFAQLAGRFLALYDETYGKGRYYLADSFNEMLPPVSDDVTKPEEGYGDATANKAKVADVDPTKKAERLAAYGRRIHESIRAGRPDAVWVMQGWLFGADKTFWTSDAIAAFLRDVPDEGMLVLDIGNDRYPDTRRTAQAFRGKGWIYGYVHNYGASNPVYGDLAFYRQDIEALAADPSKGNLKGFGVFPEGLDSNSVVYEYLYDLAWGAGKKGLPDWLAQYTRARYGQSSPALVSAWLDIMQGAFRTRYWSPRWWRSTAGAYLICKRPDVAMAQFEGAPGERDRLRAGIDAMLALSADYAHSSLFRTDLIDFTRHLGSLHLDDLIKASLVSYAAGDIGAADQNVDAVRTLTRALDDLMGAQPHHLAGWIAQARAYGDTAAEKDDYERNARAQVTVWGGDGNLHDYASKAWQGLYADVYLQRWNMMFEAQRQAAISRIPFDQSALTVKLIAWERAWARSLSPITLRVPATPIADVGRLLNQLPKT